MNPRPDTVGVIDVGSNTIKLLIAKRGNGVPAEKVEFLVEETRIGEGMVGQPPIIEEEAIARGAAAIARLAKQAAACDSLCIVATSAVRDAANKQAFVNAVEKACDHELRILSGEEEASLIGLALKCDPALSGLHTFSLIDLGGGSLECIQFLNHSVLALQSLQLGSLRLACLLLSDRKKPLAPQEQRRIRIYTQEHWMSSALKPNSSPSNVVVLTGGAAKHLADALPGSLKTEGITLETFHSIVQDVCSLSFSERIERYGVPASRADIFPTAMLTLEESIGYLGCNKIHFSEFNLRYGVATTLLSKGALVT